VHRSYIESASYILPTEPSGLNRRIEAGQLQLKVLDIVMKFATRKVLGIEPRKSPA
jgi:hypothetical protein